MKIEDLTRPSLLTLGALGIAGLAATALAGFAVGMAVSRDPEALKRNARALARQAARGVEQATLLAAQAREHLGDLWAEAREEALAEVDAADFARAAAAAAPAARRTRAKAATASGLAAKKPRSKPRNRRGGAAPAPDVSDASTTEAGKSADA
jgi:hypothetical protein